MNRSLSASEAARYARDGYLARSGLFGDARVLALSEWARELADAPEVRGTVMKYFEDDPRTPGQRLLNRIENFVPFHEGFRQLATEGPLIDLVSVLLGELAVLFKDKINLKLPGGGGFEPHQDIQAGWNQYADSFISASIAIDEATVENGCLEIAAGQHTRGLIGRLLEPLSGSELDGVVFQPVPQAPGDVIVFEGYTPHRSAKNTTSRPRRNLYLTYTKASAGDLRERYFAEKRKNFPPDFEREPGKKYVYRV
jgi:2-aminoethylphosphonate dioxygenase